MKVETYVFFEGRCDEALDFYQKALGAKVETRMRFSESPDPVPKPMLPPGGAQKIMHASFTVGETRIMPEELPVTYQKLVAEFAR